MQTNLATVKAIYDAFGQGNIPFILETVDENFTWTDPCDPAKAPQGGTFVGREGFMGFFQKLGGSVDTTLWEVENYVADGNDVVATGKHGIAVKSTGKSEVNDWIMNWHFKNGKPVSGRSYFDTARYEQLFK
jgi:uncharacterized protein